MQPLPTHKFIDYNIQNDKCFLILSSDRIIIIIICDLKSLLFEIKGISFIALKF